MRGNLGEVAAPPARRAVVQRTPHLDAAEEPPRERLRLQRRHLALAREPGVARRAPRSARGFAVHRSLRQHLGVGAPRDPVGEAALAEDVRAVRVRGVAVLHEVAAYLARELAHDALVGEHVRDWETHRPTPRSSTRERGAPRRQLLPLPSKREIARCEPRLGSVREGGLAGNGKKRKKM